MIDTTAVFIRVLTPLILSFGLFLAGTAYGADVDAGKAVYDRFCIYCHGPKGEGDGPAGSLSGVPTGDLSNKAYMSLLSDQELHDRIAWGEERFPYLQMPGWRSSLSDDEIWNVVAYIRTLAVDKGPLTTPSPKEREKRFRTDPLERGRIYYLRYCSGCHGKTGRGDGEGARNLAHPPVALSDPQVAARLTVENVKRYLIEQERRGDREMPVFEDDFQDKIAEIVSYIKTLAKTK